MVSIRGAGEMSSKRGGGGKGGGGVKRACIVCGGVAEWREITEVFVSW